MRRFVKEIAKEVLADIDSRAKTVEGKIILEKAKQKIEKTLSYAAAQQVSNLDAVQEIMDVLNWVRDLIYTVEEYTEQVS